MTDVEKLALLRAMVGTPMYNAVQEVARKSVEIAREVFG